MKFWKLELVNRAFNHWCEVALALALALAALLSAEEFSAFVRAETLCWQHVVTASAATVN